MIAATSASHLAVSQAADALNQDEVDALLAEIESQNRTRSVFGVSGHRKIAEVRFDSQFKVVKNLGNWRIIEFNQPSVPGWVSSDYVTVANGRATVSANRLNMRIEPSAASPVLVQLIRDYESVISGRKNGFIRVLAPSAFRVALFSGSDLDAESNTSIVKGSKWNTDQATVNDVVSTGGGAGVETSGLGSPRIESSSLDPSMRADQRAVISKSKNIVGKTDTNVKQSERLHVIAPGDSVSLLVFGESDLSIQNVRVPQSGRVSFPLIGSIVVAGRTTSQVEKSVSELLAQGYVKNPRISVTMFSYRPIFIRGAVRQTGSFPFSEGLTVGKAIALAGGTKNSAKPNGVSILREGDVIEQALSIDSQAEVQSGDVISIEEEFGVQEDDADATYIYLHGEVASPGEYKFRRGLTVEKAIVLAGGFTLRGARNKISVTRYAGTDTDQEPDTLKKVKLYTPIKPGDIINVGASWF
ncbi:MAG: SLBB domain-containing protein [Arenicella sp.]|nr:SLBB domain-containing protein [Arenicella sp.]